MTVEEIKSNIRYNEDLIDQYIREKRILERRIADFDLLKNKYISFQNAFGEQQQSRQRKLASFLSSNVQNQIVGKFYDGMNGLLFGTDFNNAYEGLTEAKRVINRKITELDQQLDDCKGNLAYRRGRLDYWQRELEAALAEEGI